MKKPQKNSLIGLKALRTGALGLSALILFSGAMAAPPTISPLPLPPSLLKTPSIAMPVVQVLLPRPTLRKKLPQSRLAKRLNDRYRIGRSLHASA